MAFHQIELNRAALHGKFSRDLTPILTIASGDTVRFQTLDAGWGVEPHRADGSPRGLFTPRDPERDSGHAMCGPVFVEGAEPGMTLEVRIDTVQPGAWGFNTAGGWDSAVNRRLGVADLPGVVHRWTLDSGSMTGTNQHGHTVALRPFMGVMGLPPDEPGLHPSAPPRVTGGNMDCKELVAGSSLFLPIAVPGGLFSTGDGHAAQGDGEVSTTAIECPMEQVELTFILHPALRITTPRAVTPTGLLTLGFHQDINEAMYQALEAMLDWMTARCALSRQDALALASIVVDLRITQIVNGVCGVHAVLPHGALQNIPEHGDSGDH